MFVVYAAGIITIMVLGGRALERYIESSNRAYRRICEEHDHDFDQYFWEIYEDPKRDTSHEPISFDAWWEEKQRPRLAPAETPKVTPYR